MKIEKINKAFEKTTYRILKHRWGILTFFAVILALSFAGVKKIVMKTSFDDYFLSDDPMLIKTDEFKSVFGNDYYVAVLVQNKNIFSERSLCLIRKLSNELMGSLSYAEKITSLTDLEFTVGNDEGLLIEQIVPENISSDPDSLRMIKNKAYSKPHIARKLVSKDGRMAWILVKLRPFPEKSEWKKISDSAPDMITGKEVEHIINKAEYEELSPNAAGMPYLNYEKFAYLKSEMGRLMLFALVAAVLIMFIVTRSIRGIISPLLTSVSGVIIGFGTIGWCGLYIDMSVSMIAVILVFACSIAYNIHIYNFFKTRFTKTGKRKTSIAESIGGTGWGVLLAGITTIAAMMTFLAMKIVPMQAIGLNTALCLFSVLITCLFITPVLLSFGKDKSLHPDMAKSFEGYMGNQFEKLGIFVMCNHRRIGIVATILTVICGIGLCKIEPAFDIERTIGNKVPYAQRFLDLCNTELGSMYSYDLMIILPENGDAKKTENLVKLEQLARHAEGYKLTKRHNSVLDIIKDMNYTLNGNNNAYYKIPESEDLTAQLLLLYENAGGTESEYWMDYDYRRLRLQIEIKSYNSNKAEKEMEDIQVEARKSFPDAHVSVVGNLPQFTVMQQYVERGQMWSMLLSVIVIGIILVLIFGNWRVGLIGMIPNIAPAIIVGGIMGWLNYPLDMMTASLIPMILGISVDDTIHFINHGHLEYNIHKTYGMAINKTFGIAGLAVVLSTVIICATFSGFTVSNAIQIRNWGLLAVIGLLSALLADLFITPILLKRLHVFGQENINN